MVFHSLSTRYSQSLHDFSTGIRESHPQIRTEVINRLPTGFWRVYPHFIHKVINSNIVLLEHGLMVAQDGLGGVVARRTGDAAAGVSA